MPLSLEDLREHLAYSAWASRRLVVAASELTAAELERDFATADRSVLGTLVHIFAADRLWLARLRGAPLPRFVTPDDHRLTVLENDWPDVHRQCGDWLNGLDDAAALADFAYQDLEGRDWNQPIWQLVLHVVNHATHHRGQVSGFLRAMGRTPPVLDLVAFYRQKP
jgi:uncharacterized damage-inducible protein DinB